MAGLNPSLARRVAPLLAAAAIASASVGCGGRAADPLAGAYTVKGGGAPLDVFNALASEFTRRHPSVAFRFEDIGSRPGMVLAASGDVDLATSSAEPPANLVPQVELVSVGITGTAVVVSASNPVTGLAREQIRGIFAGEITDWATVGGKPGNIFVATRNPGSAIRKNFEAYIFENRPVTYGKDTFEVDDLDHTITAVTGRYDVVSIITINDRTLTDSHIRLLAVDGVRPTKETLASGVYPMRRPLYLVYHKAGVKPAIRAFLDFVQSPDGQKIIAMNAAA